MFVVLVNLGDSLGLKAFPEFCYPVCRYPLDIPAGDGAEWLGLAGEGVDDGKLELEHGWVVAV